MRKLSLFLIASLMLAFFSCSNNEDVTNPSEEKAEISIEINGIVKGLTKAPGVPGSIITDTAVIDSLVKNIRLLAFDPVTTKCVAYADLDIVRLSQKNVLKMTVTKGKKDFIVVANVNKLMPSQGLVGKSKDQMITFLSQNDFYGSDTRFRNQAPHMFYALIEGKTVVVNPTFENETQNHYKASLVRLVSQLETTIDKTLVTDDDGTGSYPNFIVSLDTIIVRNTSPDMSLSRLMNNQAPTLDASNAHIASTTWRVPTASPGKQTNFLLAFPTDPIGTYPYVIIGATVNSNNAPANFALATGESAGNVKRYWSVQLKNNHLRENVRLLLDITKLKGGGSNTHPKPQEIATCEFEIKLADWDPIIDTESGEGVH